MKKQQYLRRYTNLPSLFDILKNKRITLLNPNTWDDRNDSFFIEQYRIKLNLRTVLGLCFTGRGETYHHWKVFSDGSSGVCILFNRDKLLRTLTQIGRIKYNNVSYKRINELKTIKINVGDMPYVKRLPYKDEKEFRIIYESMDEDVNYKHINIELDCIERITLSPWVPEPLIDPLKKTIKGISKSNNIKVWKTTLLSNDNWKEIGKNV